MNANVNKSVDGDVNISINANVNKSIDDYVYI